MSLFSSLKRRNVFRTALAYGVAAWLLAEVMGLITGTFEAPAWVLKVFVSVLVVGFVPVMVFSWLYEITPEGIKREVAKSSEHSVGTARKLDIAVLAMLAIAIGIFLVQRFTSETSLVSPAAEVTVPSTTTPPAAKTEGPPMVAVLPFASNSLEGDSDFFATGVHDDLLTQLAKLQSIRVISRTSVLEYRNTEHNIRAIGAALGADVILEGGVQTAGDRIRINAQLIDAHTDEHLWAETYDRLLSLSNIFDVQREIAHAIAAALNATLTVQDRSLLSVIPTENMAAYRAFRRAMDIRNSESGGFGSPEFIAALEEAVSLDPSFARAWAELAGGLAKRNLGLITTDPEIAGAVENALEQLRAIAPNSAEYLIAQAYYIYYVLRDYDHAHDVVSRALTKNPSDVHVLELKTWIERRQGNWDARTESYRELAKLDPHEPGWTALLINNLFVTHRYDESMAEFHKSSLDSIRAADIGAMLTYREDNDAGRLLKSMKEIYLGREATRLSNLWVAYLLYGDLSGAVDYLDALDLQALEVTVRLPGPVRDGLFTYWLMNQEARLQEYVSYARRQLENWTDANGEATTYFGYLHMALVEAADGNVEDAMRLIRRWQLLAASDLAEESIFGRYSCWILGMVEATSASVNCLRAYLEKPSNATPFVDPYLPFFDSMRDEQEFKELLSDVKAGRFDRVGTGSE